MAWLFLPLRRWLLAALEFTRGAGTVGIFAYLGLYSAASVALLPGSVLTLAAGFAWGPILGTAIAWVSANLASSLCFWISRSLAGDWAARRVGDRRLLGAIERAVSRNGLRVVLLLRLSPVVPFNLLNYALGLTEVRFRDYLLGGAIGMLPGTAMYVYLGSLISSLSQVASGAPAGGGPARAVLYWGGLGATILVSALLTHAARKELRRELDRPEDASEDTK